MMNPGLFQVLQLWVFDLAIDLRHGLFSAHGEHRMTQPDQNPNEADGVWQRRVLQPAQRIVRIDKVRQVRPAAEGGSLEPKACRTHHAIISTTITVVTYMMRSAFSLDSGMPLMFSHQK